MRKYNRPYQKSNENIMETLKIEIKRNSSVEREREVLVPRRVKNIKALNNKMDDEEIIDLIPLFSPSSPNSLSVEEWIETIDDLKVIYGWDDSQTLIYASIRLEDAAKRFFKENSCDDWSKFKVKFERRFSNRISKTEYLKQLQRRRKEPNESFENFVYDVERTAIKCECGVDSTIKYIINGLSNSSLRKHLFACKCKSVDELLSRIKTFIAAHKSNDDLRNLLDRSSSNAASNEATEDHASKKNLCYKCKKPGHIKSECRSKSVVNDSDKPRLDLAPKESETKAVPKCSKCKKFGHNTDDCYFNDYCQYCNREGHSTNSCRYNANIQLCNENGENGNLRNGIDKQVYCPKCRAMGHRKEDCHLNKTFCNNCKRKGHTINDCWYNLNKQIGEEQQGPKINTQVFCVICKKMGHCANDCRLNSNNGSLIKPFCNNCNRKGHDTYDCWFNAEKEFYEQNTFDRNNEAFFNGAQINNESFCEQCQTVGHHINDCNFSSNFNSNRNFNEDFCNNWQGNGYNSYESGFKDNQLFEQNMGNMQNTGQCFEDNNISNAVFCFKCKMEGHFAWDCNVKDVSSYERPDNSKNYPVKLKFLKKFISDKISETIHSTYNHSFKSMFCWKCKSKSHDTKDCSAEPDKKILSGELTFNKNLKRNFKGVPCELPAKKHIPEKQVQQICSSEFRLPGRSFKCQPKALNDSSQSARGILNNTSINPNRSLGEFLKPVRIDNVYVTGFVDLGSDCTTLQRSEFEKHGWQMEPNIEHGPISSSTYGKIYKNVCVGEVELMIDILIVEDSIQDFPMVLGTNFLDHPSVCVVKKYRSLEIKLVDSMTDNLVATPSPPSLSFDGQMQIKNEPDVNMEEHHIMELLDMIKEECT